MKYFSISAPYGPMDFRALCQCNEHKDTELHVWYKKHDKKIFLRQLFRNSQKSNVNLCVFWMPIHFAGV